MFVIEIGGATGDVSVRVFVIEVGGATGDVFIGVFVIDIEGAAGDVSIGVFIIDIEGAVGDVSVGVCGMILNMTTQWSTLLTVAKHLVDTDGEFRIKYIDFCGAFIDANKAFKSQCQLW